MDEMENRELMDFETIHEKRSDELTELLDKRDMKQLQRRMEEMNEFDVAEFLTEIEDNRMPMVFRLLSKAGYTGWLLVEAEQDPAKADPLEYAIKARSYIREHTGL